MTDVQARIADLQGSVEIARLQPDAPAFVVKGSQSTWQVARTCFRLGVDHILSGFDLLLFVLALILLIGNPSVLAKTITAFTTGPLSYLCRCVARNGLAAVVLTLVWCAPRITHIAPVQFRALAANVIGSPSMLWLIRYVATSLARQWKLLWQINGPCRERPLSDSAAALPYSGTKAMHAMLRIATLAAPWLTISDAGLRGRRMPCARLLQADPER